MTKNPDQNYTIRLPKRLEGHIMAEGRALGLSNRSEIIRYALAYWLRGLERERAR